MERNGYKMKKDYKDQVQLHVDNTLYATYSSEQWVYP
jgi:hypothetical protein